MMRTQIGIFILSFLLSLVSSSKFKNILFIVADDLGWADVGYENEQPITPNIDALAAKSVILNQSYAYPLCTPSRNSFLSGVYAERTGLQHHVILPEQPIGLPTTFRLLPDVFKKFDYATHAIGKWHLGFCNLSYTPTYRGFDTFYGYYNAQNDYYTHRVGGDILRGDDFDGLDFWDQTVDDLKPVLDQNNTYSMFTYVNRAVDIIDNHDKDKPFFMYFAAQNCHSPLEVPKQYKDKYKNIKDESRRTYLGMVSVLDEAIGNLTYALDRNGLLNDTIIFFTSDNGGAVYAGASNYPLRGSKMTVFEGGTRVKGFINGVDLKPFVYDGMFHAVDWMPTILNAAIGIPVELTDIDGINQWPSLTQNLPSERVSFIYNLDPFGIYGCKMTPTEAIRFKKWKLIRGCPGEYNDWYPIPKYDKNLADFSDLTNYSNLEHISEFNKKNNTTFYLFDIENDPLEKNNLADEYPDVVKALNIQMDEFKKNSVPPLNPPNLQPDEKSNPKYWNDTWSPGWC